MSVQREVIGANKALSALDDAFDSNGAHLQMLGVDVSDIRLSVQGLIHMLQNQLDVPPVREIGFKTGGSDEERL